MFASVIKITLGLVSALQLIFHFVFRRRFESQTKTKVVHGLILENFSFLYLETKQLIFNQQQNISNEFYPQNKELFDLVNIMERSKELKGIVKIMQGIFGSGEIGWVLGTRFN